METTRIGVPASDTVLDALPMRVVAFLRGVATHPEVRARMTEVGYDEAAHREGQRLLAEVLALGPEGDATAARRAADETRHALDALDAYARTHVPRLARAASRALPEVPWPVEADVVARGAGALVVTRLLDVLDARGEGDALVALLASRGLDASRRAALRAMIATATRLCPAAETRHAFVFVKARELAALYAWYTEWAAAARTVLPRGDLRLRVGIGQRRAADVEV